MRRLLTLHVRHRVELVPPLLTDMDGSASTHTVVRHTPVVVVRLDEGLGVLRVERVHHVEEVAPVRHPTLWQLIREVDHHLRFVLELGVKVLDAKFLKFWHHHHFDLCEGQQLFLLIQNFQSE